MKLLSTLVVAIISAYAFLTAYVYFRQANLLYFPNIPSRDIYATPTSVGLDFENIQLVTMDNIKLHAWFIPHRGASDVVLFCHGNAGNISHRLDTLKILHNLGLSVLIFDYRGYGLSEGKPNEKGTSLDASAAWQYLREERQYTASDIIVWGRSLGGAVAAKLAEGKVVKGVVLESTFTSVPELAQQLYPFLPVKALSRFNYDVKESIKKIARPLLIVHSRDDEIIPYSHGETLFRLANQPKQLLEISGSHDNGFFNSYDDYYRTLKDFIAKLS